jgi:hypothetical protein
LDELAMAIIEGKVKENDHVKIKIKDEKLQCEVK